MEKNGISQADIMHLHAVYLLLYTEASFDMIIAEIRISFIVRVSRANDEYTHKLRSVMIMYVPCMQYSY